MSSEGEGQRTDRGAAEVVGAAHRDLANWGRKAQEKLGADPPLAGRQLERKPSVTMRGAHDSAELRRLDEAGATEPCRGCPLIGDGLGTEMKSRRRRAPSKKRGQGHVLRAHVVKRDPRNAGLREPLVRAHRQIEVIWWRKRRYGSSSQHRPQ